MKLILPPCETTVGVSDLKRDCVVCGAKPAGGLEYEGADGMIGMSIDDGLCLECACLLFRAAEEVYPDQFLKFAISLLARYSVTKEAVMRQISEKI